MKILGVDPGLETTGYGIIDDGTLAVIEAGVIRTRANTPIQERLIRIFGGLEAVIGEHKPRVLVLEKMYSHHSHPATVITMAHARAMACLVCGVKRVQLINYPSTRIKKAITGNGHASKKQVQRMIQNLLGLKDPPEPVDVSDALAMALCYCLTTGKRRSHDLAYLGKIKAA